MSQTIGVVSLSQIHRGAANKFACLIVPLNLLARLNEWKVSILFTAVFNQTLVAIPRTLGLQI
jgi:hypothetical protein